MVSRIVVGLLMIVSCFGQRSDTVYQTLFTNATTSPQHIAVTNIGQSSHLAFVTLANAPAHTCSSKVLSGGLEYSFDNTNFFSFSTPSNFSSTVVAPTTYVALGAYPFIRMNTGFDNTNCIASGFYVGTIQAQSVYTNGNVLTNTPLFNLANAWISNPVFSGGIGSGGNSFPNIVCDQSAQSTLTVGTNAIAGATNIAPSSTNVLVYVCSLVATTAGTATVQLFYGPAGGGNCAGGGNISLTPTLNVISSAPLNLGSGVGFITKGLTIGGAGGVQVQICASVTGATTNVMLTYAVLPIAIMPNQ